jgi:hypothetical protein
VTTCDVVCFEASDDDLVVATRKDVLDPANRGRYCFL